MGRFLIRKVNTGVKFDLLAANGESVLSSEVYLTEAACRNGIASIVKNAPQANVEDQTLENSGKAACPKFEIYTDRGGKYRFRLKARNGAIIGVSEGYKAKANCENGIASVRRNSEEAQIDEEQP